MKVVGLTGGIATGKSTVGRRLAALGLPVLDADQVSREVVAPGQPALAELVERLGEGILDQDGRLDRAAMRDRIARDPEAKKTLEAVTHPAILGAILQRIQALAAQGETLAVVEAALMVETGSYKSYPFVVVVTCDPATQLRRLMARDGMDEVDARRLIATQMPLAEKEAAATHLIHNDGSEAELLAQVDALVAELRAA